MSLTWHKLGSIGGGAKDAGPFSGSHRGNNWRPIGTITVPDEGYWAVIVHGYLSDDTVWGSPSIRIGTTTATGPGGSPSEASLAVVVEGPVDLNVEANGGNSGNTATFVGRVYLSKMPDTFHPDPPA